MGKKWILQCVAAGLFAVAAPVLCYFAGFWSGSGGEVSTTPPQLATEPMTEAATLPPETVSGSVDGAIVIPVSTDTGIEDMPLDEYLTGVLLAEIPESFHDQARQAQAVAARTFTLWLLEHPKHGLAAVCTDSACCQAWREPGEDTATALAAQAVADTDGQVVVYQGALIDATYFSCSGGRTEAAVAVWGSDVPYLQSVESPGEEIAEHDMDTVLLTAQELREKILAQEPEVDLAGSPGDWFTDIRYTEGGGIAALKVGGVEISGTRLRQILGLRSTNITITATDSGAMITTRGYGHRVGLSQYGAQAMALEGSTYAEILTHYYVGTELAVYGEN